MTERCTHRQTAEARAEMRERLEARRPEIEQAILTRVSAVPDSSEVDDPEYAAGLQSAVSAALTHALDALDGNSEAIRPVPAELRMQARRAAREGVSIETVLRRYFVGYTSLSEFILSEAEEMGLGEDIQLRRAMRAEALILDRLLAAVVAEHAQESRARQTTAEQRRVEQVRLLLTGHLLDPTELRYRFDVWHLAVVASGPGAETAVRNLAAVLNREPLVIRPGGEKIWAWLGGTHRIASADALRSATASCPPGILLALGEPGKGIDGWRRTHRQAAAAFPVVTRSRSCVVRHADVVLLASALQDEVLAGSLRELYLAPLAGERDGGESLRQTMRAFLTAGRNVSAAAAALGVSRPTVRTRLRMIEERIGQSPDTCAAEIETALRLEELSSVGPSQLAR